MKAFVIMPFDSELDGVYDEFIRPAALKAGFEVERADDLQTSQSILRDIVGSISKADLVIADLTNNNPNVFYELGVAHAFNKPVILLAQDIADVPFDLRAYRVLPYDIHFSRIQVAREKLTTLIKLAYQNELPSGNPVSDFILVGEGVQKPPITQNDSRNSTADHSHASVDELGLLDYQVSLEEGIEGAGECVRVYTDALTQMAEAMNNATPAITADSHLSGSEKRNLARHLASQLDLVAQIFVSTNVKYSSSVEKMALGVNGLFSGKFALPNDDTTSLDGLLLVLKSLGSANAGQLRSNRALISTIDSTPPIESSLNKSTREIRQQVSTFTQTAEVMAAVIAHAIDLGSAFAEKAKLRSSQISD